jgi:hypothetical protein
MISASCLLADRPDAQPVAPGSPDAPQKEALLQKSAEAVFNFETQEIQGSIRLDGAYHGTQDRGFLPLG